MIEDDADTNYKSPVNALAFRMGKAYRNAVRNCFDLDFEGSDGLVIFRRDVIVPLIRAVEVFQELNLG